MGGIKQAVEALFLSLFRGFMFAGGVVRNLTDCAQWLSPR